MKKIISLLLTAVIAFSVITFGSVSASAAVTDNIAFEAGSVIYFDNTNTKWQNIYFYAWNYGYFGDFVPMDKVSGTNNLYKVVVPKAVPVGAEYFLFTNSTDWSGQQTKDQTVQAEKNTYTPITNQSGRVTSVQLSYTYLPAETEVTAAPYSKEFTEPLTVTVYAFNVPKGVTPTFSINGATTVKFTDSASITVTETTKITVTAGSVSKTFTYTKVDDAVITVNAGDYRGDIYAYTFGGDRVGSSFNLMEYRGNGIYTYRINGSAKVIFTTENNWDSVTQQKFIIKDENGKVLSEPLVPSSQHVTFTLELPYYIALTPGSVIYFNNSNTQWDNVYFYAWNYGYYGDFVPMEEVPGRRNIYKVVVPKVVPEGAEYFLFTNSNNWSGKQTGNMPVERGKNTYIPLVNSSGDITSVELSYTNLPPQPEVLATPYSKSFTKSITVSVYAFNVPEGETATYQVNEEEPVAFTGNNSLTFTDTTTLTVTLGDISKTYTYIKKSDAVITVTAKDYTGDIYVYTFGGDRIGASFNKMTYDADEEVYTYSINGSAQVIFTTSDNWNTAQKFIIRDMDYNELPNQEPLVSAGEEVTYILTLAPIYGDIAIEAGSRIYFDNTNTQWDEIYFYAWNYGYFGDFVTMEPVADHENLYSVVVPVDVPSYVEQNGEIELTEYFLFTNSTTWSGKQTADMSVEVGMNTYTPVVDSDGNVTSVEFSYTDVPPQSEVLAAPGSKDFTDSINVSVYAFNVPEGETATYQVNEEEPVAFTGSHSFIFTETTTLTVTLGDVSKTYTYTKKPHAVITVTAKDYTGDIYVYTFGGDRVGTSFNKMTYDADEEVYTYSINGSAKVIFTTYNNWNTARKFIIRDEEGNVLPNQEPLISAGEEVTYVLTI